jgi:hypothetical protein
METHATEDMAQSEHPLTNVIARVNHAAPPVGVLDPTFIKIEVNITRGPSRYFNDNAKLVLLLCLSATHGNFSPSGERLLLCIWKSRAQAPA